MSKANQAEIDASPPRIKTIQADFAAPPEAAITFVKESTEEKRARLAGVDLDDLPGQANRRAKGNTVIGDTLAGILNIFSEADQETIRNTVVHLGNKPERTTEEDNRYNTAVDCLSWIEKKKRDAGAIAQRVLNDPYENIAYEYAKRTVDLTDHPVWTRPSVWPKESQAPDE